MRVEGGIGIGGAVQQEVVRVRPVAADRDGRALAGAPVESVHVAGLRAVAEVRAREPSEPGRSACARSAGSLAHDSRIHDFSEADVLRLQRFGSCFDRHRLVLLSNGERQVEAHFLAHFKDDVACQAREPGSFDLDGVFARDEIGNVEKAAACGQRGASRTGCLLLSPLRSLHLPEPVTRPSPSRSTMRSYSARSGTRNRSAEPEKPEALGSHFTGQTRGSPISKTYYASRPDQIPQRSPVRRFNP